MHRIVINVTRRAEPILKALSGGAGSPWIGREWVDWGVWVEGVDAGWGRIQLTGLRLRAHSMKHAWGGVEVFIPSEAMSTTLREAVLKTARSSYTPTHHH